MRCDYHIHTLISSDCNVSPKEQIESAVTCGLEEICFTEHLEINFHRGEEWHTDIQNYYKIFQELDTKGLRVKFGVEAGISCEEDDLAELKEELNSVPFDYVLACAHAVKGADPFMPTFFENKTREQVFKDYLSVLLKGVKGLGTENYSAIAHIDFPAKGMGALGLKEPFLRYSDAADEIDSLFQYIIPLGKCIEINTSSYRKLNGFPIPGNDWLRRYVEFGGEFVTFGSDAHLKEHVGGYFKEAIELARNAGIKYYATYDRMVPTLHKLSSET